MFGSSPLAAIFFGSSPVLSGVYVPGDNDYGVPVVPGESYQYGIDVIAVGDYSVSKVDESNIYGVE